MSNPKARFSDQPNKKTNGYYDPFIVIITKNGACYTHVVRASWMLQLATVRITAKKLAMQFEFQLQPRSESALLLAPTDNTVTETLNLNSAIKPRKIY